MQCDLVFVQQPLSYSTDRARISFLMGLLQGNALGWASVVWELESLVTASYSVFTLEIHKVFLSVAEYAIEFHTLSLQAVFSNGLSGLIKDELVSHPEPSKLDKLISLAIRVDSRLHEWRRGRLLSQKP